MAYKATLNGEEFFNTSSMRSDLSLISASIHFSAGAAGTFDFTVPYDNVCIEEFDPDESFYLTDMVDVYKDDELIFSGRVSKCTRNFDLSIDVTCEGLLAMLNDVLSAPVILGTDPDTGEGKGITTMQGIVDYFVDEYNAAQSGKGAENLISKNSAVSGGDVITHNNYQFTFNSKTSCFVTFVGTTGSTGAGYANLFTPTTSKLLPTGITAGYAYEFSMDGGFASVRLAVIFQRYENGSYSTIKTVYVTTVNKKVVVPSNTNAMTIRLEAGYKYTAVNRTVTYSCFGPIGTSGNLKTGTILSDSDVDSILSDASGEINDEFTSYDPILSRLSSVINMVGGYFSITKNADDDYRLNYTAESRIPLNSSQNAEFGLNILNLTYSRSADNMVTCVLPFGEYDGETINIKPSEVSAFLQSHGMEYGRLSDNKVYVGLTSAINKYGKIMTTRTFVKKSAARSSLGLAKVSYKYLKSICEPERSVDISVLDLSNINGYEDKEPFEVATKITTKAGPHIKEDLTLICTDKNLNLLDPSSDGLTFDLYRKSLPKFVTSNLSGGSSGGSSDGSSGGSSGGSSVTNAEKEYWNNKSRVYRNASGALVITD